MQSSKRFWDGVAEKYSRAPIRNMEGYERTLERTASYLTATDQVLELGCGTGTTALKLAPEVAGIVASDISPEMLAVAARKAAEADLRNVSFVEAEADHPPKGPFDAALAFNLLHLVEDLDETLRQVHTSLKPGGLFISKTICKPRRGISLIFGLMRLAVPVMQMFGRAPFVRFMSGAELEAAMIRAGFEIVERASFPEKDLRRFIVARKH